MRRISMTTRDELVAAIAGRYAQGDRFERSRILDEFSAVTGFHRKHAMRLLRAGQPKARSGPRPGRRVYDNAVREGNQLTCHEADAGEVAARSGQAGDQAVSDRIAEGGNDR